MRELKTDLQSVLKSLRILEEKTKEMAKKLDKVEKAQTPEKTGAKPKAARKAVAKKPTRVSASGTVLAIVKRSKKGLDTATLKKKTGFSDKKIWNLVNSLKRQGKIKSTNRGLYVNA